MGSEMCIRGRLYRARHLGRFLRPPDVGVGLNGSSPVQSGRKILSRLRDFLRLRFPIKLDLGEMTKEELTQTLDPVILEDRNTPGLYRPLVAIAHKKDLIDSDKVESILSYLAEKGIGQATFSDAYERCRIWA